MQRTSIPRLNAAIAAALCVALITWAVILCEGRLIFSLDDPYIHLSMAEQIARGGYGINPGEPASASSSIVYPFLLAPAAALGVGEYWALALSLASVIAAAWLAGRVAEEGGVSFARSEWLGAAALCGGFALAGNLPGLALSGMEHALHVAVSLAALFGVVQFAKTGTAPLWWLLCCGAFAPAMRYEGLSISAAAAIVLALHGRWRAALFVAALAAAIVALAASFFLGLGLPLLPSSVLVKLGNGAFQGSGMQSVVAVAPAALLQAVQNLRTAEGAGLGALLLLLVSGAALGGDGVAPAARRDVALFCALVIATHLAFGHTGWMSRYTPYAICLGLAGTAFLFGATLSRLATQWRGLGAAAVSASLAVTFADPALATARSSLASASIYRQQYQMHRFIADYWRAPVAVNDVGWTSYRNDARVLDLGGLGSEAARIGWRRGDAGWMDRLVRAEGVNAAMMYEEWLTAQRPPWIRLARLELGGAHAAVAHGSVSIFAITESAAPRLRRALMAFEPTLPRGARLVWDVEPHASACADGDCNPAAAFYGRADRGLRNASREQEPVE